MCKDTVCGEGHGPLPGSGNKAALGRGAVITVRSLDLGGPDKTSRGRRRELRCLPPPPPPPAESTPPPSLPPKASGPFAASVRNSGRREVPQGPPPPPSNHPACDDEPHPAHPRPASSLDGPAPGTNELRGPVWVIAEEDCLRPRDPTQVERGRRVDVSDSGGGSPQRGVQDIGTRRGKGSTRTQGERAVRCARRTATTSARRATQATCQETPRSYRRPTERIKPPPPLSCTLTVVRSLTPAHPQSPRSRQTATGRPSPCTLSLPATQTRALGGRLAAPTGGRTLPLPAGVNAASTRRSSPES